jgi:uncharacterized protein (TIGR03067 family)
MRCAMFAAGASVLLCLAGAGPDDEATKAELMKFEGTWTIESMERDGVKAMPTEYKPFRLILKGNEWTLNEQPGSSTGTFAVDVSKKPKTIDLMYGDGPFKGKTMNGIYTLEGDTYTLCIGRPGKPRPTEFASKVGTGNVLEVLKRMK